MKMECSIKAQKVEAMKNYKKAQFLYNLVVYSLTALLSCLFYLYLFWFPSVSSATHFFSVLVPNIYSFFLSSPNKLLFIVGNLIVLFLVGESKLAAAGGGGSQYSQSPANEIYDEYIRRSRCLREIKSLSRTTSGSNVHDEHEKMDRKVAEMHSIEHKKRSMKMDHEKRSSDAHHAASRSTAEKEKLEKLVKQQEGTDYKNEDADHGEDRDELNRRVEDFIARVNRQRMLEERQLSS